MQVYLVGTDRDLRLSSYRYMMTLGIVKLDLLLLPRRNVYHIHHISAHCFQICWILFVDTSRFYNGLGAPTVYTF